MTGLRGTSLDPVGLSSPGDQREGPRRRPVVSLSVGLSTAALVAFTMALLTPIAIVFWLAVQPRLGESGGLTLSNFSHVVRETDVVLWLSNTLIVTLSTVALSVLVAAPAGYVLSRSRSRLVSGYALTLFVVQSLPIVTFVIPLFMLFARMGLVDTLLGLTIVYVGTIVTVSTWTMAAYLDSIPVALEESAWIDGCSLFQGFRKVVLPNSLPGILSTAVFAFLMAWNDYLIALVFLRSSNSFTLPVGIQSFFQLNATDWALVMSVAVIMMLPPLIVFAFLNRYLSFGGLGGALAGQ